MKNTKLLILLFLGLFLSFTDVKAETLKRKNVDNGKINVVLNSNKGYVGAIDATIKLTGNITFSKIEWNKSLNDLAMKEYEYDKKNNTVRIFLVTKNTSQNLLDKDGNLNIGNVVVTSTKTEDYNIELSKLSITNLDLVKSDIDSKKLESTGDKSFTIKIENTTKPSETNKPSDSNKPTSTKTPKPSDETNNDDKKEDNLNQDDNKIDSDENDDTNKENDNKEDSSKKESKKKLSIILIVCGIIGIISIIAGIIFYIIHKNKKEKPIIENQIIEKD